MGIFESILTLVAVVVFIFIGLIPFEIIGNMIGNKDKKKRP